MAASSKPRLRALWFQLHKWIGLLLAAAIIPISVTGAALVSHDWLDEVANPDRYAVSPDAAALPPSVYASAAGRALGPGERIASIRMPEHGGPVVVTAIRPVPGADRPPRTLVWLDPANAAVLDQADAEDGIVRLFHRLHGRLLIPGVGRQIVGWIGVAMLASALTGLWLWWPRGGRWTRGLRWKRSPSVETNLHHQAGFWISLPLAVIAFTGVWISFPAFFGAVSGTPVPSRPPPSPPLVSTAMAADDAVSAALPMAKGALASLTWPTEASPEWKVGFVQGEATAAEVLVDDASARATPPAPPKPETLARTMRRVHDGTDMGPVWQTIVFLAGVLPAGLAVTGILMWLRARRWRGAVSRRRKAGRERVPAE